jgi:hypothetical protein
MKYMLQIVFVFLILCTNNLNGQSKSNNKEDKPRLFFEYGQGVSLLNSFTFP